MGYYFQTTLLKSIACWNEETYQISNHKNRKTIVTAIEKMFRLSEACGCASFMYHLRSSSGGSGGGKPSDIEFPLMPLSERSIKLMDFLLNIKIDEVFVPGGGKAAVAVAAKAHRPSSSSSSTRKDWTDWTSTYLPSL